MFRTGKMTWVDYEDSDLFDFPLKPKTIVCQFSVSIIKLPK